MYATIWDNEGLANLFKTEQSNNLFISQQGQPEQRSAIFGGAKPVDTLSKELQVEEKLHHQEEEAKAAPPKPKAASANIFGSARPVDTAAREREIEEKLKAQSISSDRDRDRDRG